MNIETNSKIIGTTQSATTTTKQISEDGQNFSVELNNLAKAEKGVREETYSENIEQVPAENIVENKTTNNTSTTNKPDKFGVNNLADEKLNNIFDGLKNTVEEINKINDKNLLNTNNKLTQKEEKSPFELKNNILESDKIDNSILKEEENLINNELNIQEHKEPLMPQMNAGMNFNSNGQPFSEFINNQTEQNSLQVSEKDLEEEMAILSTMSENIAIANKNMAIAKREKKDLSHDVKDLQTITQSVEEEVTQAEVKTVINSDGVKKVNTKSNITVETVVKYDTVIMDKNDVEFFTKLVENGSVQMESQEAIKSAKVSKTLADLITKAMKDNQPVRIDFDNNISVIIKIGKDGKISADFLPSSQIAETYLKENLPLLKQRFDENNIEYDELNQRKQKQNDKENRKKGRKDE